MTGDVRCGECFETVYCGLFHGMSLIDGNAAAVVELTHTKKTVANSRNRNAEIAPEEFPVERRGLVAVPLHLYLVSFSDGEVLE